MLNFPFRTAAPHQKYIRDWNLDYFAYLPLIFVGSEKTAKIYKVINNSTTNFLISLKFGTEFDHVTPDLQYVEGQGVKCQGQSMT